MTTTQFISLTVPAGSFSVIADIVETESPDLDMLLFLDVEDDGPDLDDANEDDACMSASGGSQEFCEILSPTAGTYYVAVLNYSEANEGGDWTDLATAVLPESGADLGNMTVSGPVTVTDNAPYTLTVDYDVSGATAIDELYGYFTVGTDGGNVDDVATVRVYLEYLGVPDIDIDPAVLSMTVAPEANLTETLVLSTAGGVLDWNVTTPSGDEAVQDGSFEEGYADNPYWVADASQYNSQLPICSAATCGPAFASDGDWYCGWVAYLI